MQGKPNFEKPLMSRREVLKKSAEGALIILGAGALILKAKDSGAGKKLIDDAKEAYSDKNFYDRLENIESVIEKETGLTSDKLRELHNSSLNEILQDKRWAKVKKAYSLELLQNATWGSAVYEMLAKNILDKVGDYAHKGASVGVFQAYLPNVAAALANPGLRKYLKTSGDKVAQEFISQLPSDVDNKTIRKILERRRLLLLHYGPAHSSPSLSLAGKIWLTLYYADKLLKDTPSITNLPIDLQTRILADAESGAGQGFYLSRGANQKKSKFQIQTERAEKGETVDIVLPSGNRHNHDTLKKLGIPYRR